jgi:hypothetical protein
LSAHSVRWHEAPEKPAEHLHCPVLRSHAPRDEHSAYSAPSVAWLHDAPYGQTASEQSPPVQFGSHAHLSCSPHDPWFEHEFAHVAAADVKREASTNIFIVESY